jgi:hypothetical protein
MHTKEELTKKKAKSSEQLDLVSTISSADRIKHKRRWLYLALFITTGLSLIFWLYRSFQTFSFPKSLPQVNLNLRPSVSASLSFSPQLSNLLSQHLEITGLYLSHDHPSSVRSYGSISPPDLDSLETTLASLPPTPKAPDAALLPEGTVYHERIANIAGQTTVSVLITNPIDQIVLVFHSTGSPDSLKTLTPQIISSAYWSVSSN